MTLYGRIKALKNVNFQIRKNEVFSLVGETGCGKTVTSLALLGLLPSNARPRGKIFFEQEQLTAQNVEQKRGRDIAVVFQDPMTSLNPLYTVRQQLADVLMARRQVPKKEALRSVVDILREVQMLDANRVADLYPHELSGGMKQRVMIAMALSCRPKLLIADEPTTALDVTIQKQILWLMKSLREKHGFSILFITHDMGVVAEFAHRVGVMYAGSIVEIATKRRLFKNPLHPYTVGLLNAVPNPRVGGKLRAIPGSVPSLVNPPTGCRFNERCERAFRKCFKETPPLIEVEDQHYVACHVYGGDENG
ncbi:MAG: ABC transporter ATP-binding protein [Thermotogaceae bacterium]|nr:ABC transporter ATP-binding protein [Thermotogaceae bacterium]